MGNARNLARLVVDANGDVDVTSLGNVPPSNDASALTTGTLPIARIGSGAITADKLVPGAGGKILQVAQAQKTDIFSTAGYTMVDVPGLSVTLTPNSASSRFLVLYDVHASSNYWKAFLNIDRNGTPLGLADAAGSRNRSTTVGIEEVTMMNSHGTILPLKGMIVDSPSATSALTYKVKVSGRSLEGGGTTYVNRSSPDRTSGEYDDRLSSRIIVMEIA